MPLGAYTNMGNLHQSERKHAAAVASFGKAMHVPQRHEPVGVQYFNLGNALAALVHPHGVMIHD